MSESERERVQLPSEIELQVLDQETESQTVKDVLRYPTKERKDYRSSHNFWSISTLAVPTASVFWM